MVCLRRLSKIYGGSSGPFSALAEIDLEVAAGDFVAIVGRSGSGKSTLLNVVGGIDRPSSGAVIVAGTEIGSLSEKRLALWRGRTVGIVFQFFQLIPTLTALENVLLPMDFARLLPARLRRPRALALLERVGLAPQADKLPFALSGGEQQRVAIARALANDPPLLLADEPTGNLDSPTGDSIFRLLEELHGEGKTVLLVTHERQGLPSIDRTVTIADGRVADTP